MVTKQIKKRKTKFDFKGFWLLNGLGIGISGIGVLILWATYTAPEGGGSESYALSTTQRLARMLPDETQSKIAAVLSILFILFGCFLLIMSFVQIIKFLILKR